MQYTERKELSRLAVRLAGRYELNFYDVLLALCVLSYKLHADNVSLIGQKFVEMYEGKN